MPGGAAPRSSRHIPRVTAASTAHARQEPAVLPRELADFLIEFSIALHKHAIYPAGHPLLGQAVQGVVQRAAALFTEGRPALGIGVARRQLVVEGIPTDPDHPLLRDLALRLNRHHLGGMRIGPAVTRDEFAALLPLLGTDPSRLDLPIGLADPEALEQWPNVRILPLSFEQLRLVEESEHDDGTPGGRAGSAAALWIGLAQSILSSKAEEAESADPTLLAEAVESHAQDPQYDQTVAGYLTLIAREIRTAKGREVAALQQRVSRLVEQLRPETLDRLLAVTGDAIQRNRFVLNATAAMSSTAVVDLVQAAANASAQGVSHSFMRMLTKFAAHTGDDIPALREESETALREHVQRLIGEWTLDDPNPTAYGKALEGMAKADPLYPASAAYPCEPSRLVAMGLEVGAVGDPVWRAVDALCDAGRMDEVLRLVEDAPAGWARDAVRERIASPDRLRALLERGAEAVTLRAVAEPLGIAALDPLVDALADADDRLTEHVGALLAPFAREAGEAILRRLPSARWGHQRVLIATLGRLPERPAGYTPLDWALHPDRAVRREAIRQMLRDPAQRDDGVLIALLDADEATLRLGLGAALAGCPPAAAPTCMQRADDATLPVDIRALAVRAVASARTPSVCQWLVQRSLGPKRLFGQALVEPSPQLVAAVEGLAAHFPGDPEAGRVVALAARSRDPEVRAAARRTSGTVPSRP